MAAFSIERNNDMWVLTIYSATASTKSILCDADPLPNAMMHYNPNKGMHKAAKWMSVRGSSSLEIYHSEMFRILSGKNYSPEVANMCILNFNYRWNRERGITNRGDLDHWTTNSWVPQEWNVRLSAVITLQISVSNGYQYVHQLRQ